MGPVRPRLEVADLIALDRMPPWLRQRSGLHKPDR